MIHKKALLWNDENEAKLFTYVWERSEELKPNRKNQLLLFVLAVLIWVHLTARQSLLHFGL